MTTATHLSRRVVASAAIAVVLWAMSGTLSAGQEAAPASLTRALADTAIQGALTHIDQHAESTSASLVELASIVSPSGQEQRRAETVAARMRQIGLKDVRVDDTPNVVGIIPGRSSRALVFVSTLDDLPTVAEQQKLAQTPPRVDGTHVVGPGTSTSATTAALLAAAEALVASGLVPEHDLVFAAVAQEETGLVGMKHLFEQYRNQALAFVDVLGDGASINYGAIAIHWWKVEAAGPGGHTLNGGLPNVNQGIARAVDRILGLPQPIKFKDQRTVINIAVLNSGSVFNHKPETGWFSLDIRSLDPKIVTSIERDVRGILERAGSETQTKLTMEPYSLTAGGQISGARDSELVQTSAAIARHLGLEPKLSNAGSANLNVPIGAGSPAIGIGGERGGRRGSQDEWADIPAMLRAAKHIVLLAATLGGATTPVASSY